jgi:TM2 domain-containing membrane protein YozV
LLYFHNVILNKNIVNILFILVVYTVSPESSSTQDSSDVSAINLKIDEKTLWKPDSLQRFNPAISGIASLILPGAGQVYTGHYIKGFFFPALEATFLSMAWFWHENASYFNDKARVDRAWQAWDQTPSDQAAEYGEKALLNRYRAIDARFSEYNFIGWATGAHLFNVLNALQSSNAFSDDRERSPKTAGLLAAIPGLGLGQFYNGSLSKAGMVIMGQTSLGFMAYNSHRLMNNATLHYARLNDPHADSLTVLFRNTYSDDWFSFRQRSFTNRNMYLWYSIFFYFYSIFDSVVDAYLHDYPQKMKIAPDLVVGPEFISITISTTLRLPKAAL